MTNGTTYYINCYDKYADGWDGTTYAITAGPTLVANNGGASPNGNGDSDGSSSWEYPPPSVIELESSEAFSYIPPTCPDPNTLSATNFTTVGADLGWTETGSATAWDLEIGSNGFTPTGTPTNNDVGANPYTWSGGAANTAYDFYVRADCGMDNTDVSTWIGPYSFFTGYCQTSGSNSGRYVNNFSTANGSSNISNLGSGYSTNGYGDFTGMTVSSFDGGSVDFTASFTGGTFHFGIWVDWNNDLDFDDLNEEVYLDNATYSSSKSGTISVPGGTALGNYRMRIRANWSGNAAPCNNDGLGEAEDYTFTVTTPPSCPAPSALGASNFTAAGADLSWTENGTATAWDLEIGLEGFVPTGIPTNNDVGDNPLTWSDGAANTTYDFYVRADCGMDDTDVSNWFGPFSFTTACGVFDVPFSEDFESAATPAMPTCWTVENLNGSNTWVTTSSPSLFSGKAARYPWNGSNPADDWMYSPGINLVGGTEYTLTYSYGSAGFDEALEVYYGSSASAAGMTELVVDHGTFDDGPFTVSYSITPGADGVYYFGWHAYSAADQFNLEVDDISLIETPACPVPAAVSTSGTTYNGTNVNFTCTGCTGSVIVEFGEAPHTPGVGATAGSGGTIVSGAVSPQAISLDPSTTYEIYVRQDCSLSLDGFSDNTTAVTVSTPAPPPANDECAGAISLITGFSCVAPTNGTVANSTQSIAPIFCGFTSAAAFDVWYSFVANATESTVDVDGSSSFDAIIDIREGACPGVNIACADATGNGGVESVTFPTVVGQTYYVRVYDFGSSLPTTPDFTICAYGTFVCSTDLTLEVTMPSLGTLPTFDLFYVPTGEVVQSGGGGVGNAAPAINAISLCTADGPFAFAVNGMPAGGTYKLRLADAPFTRLIDNIDAVAGFSAVNDVLSPASNGPVQIPIGPTELLYTSCDKYFWKKGEFIVVNEDPDVAAEWVPGGGTAGQDPTTGYDFWFYDPNGGYSFIRQRRHNVSDGFGNVGSPRTCHMQVNNWATANWIPNQVPLNVRVRAVVNNVPKNWGPACRFMRDDALALCPPTKLMDVPGNPFISCNVFRDFNNQSINRLYARPISGATQYRFTFSSGEPTIVRTVNTYYLVLGWNAGVAAPLTPGSSYQVTVEAFKGGVWCTAGEACTVTINNAVNGGQQNSAMDAATDATLNMYPNPNNGDQLYISLSATEEGVNTVSMDIYDLSGKRMIARTIAAQDGFVNTVVDLNGDLAAGMYMVNITAGDLVYTQRLVIQP
ncbi:MAG: GEVED domain-containing protein [Flavobacteriales bacterium]